MWFKLKENFPNVKLKELSFIFTSDKLISIIRSYFAPSSAAKSSDRYSLARSAMSF